MRCVRREQYLRTRDRTKGFHICGLNKRMSGMGECKACSDKLIFLLEYIEGKKAEHLEFLLSKPAAVREIIDAEWPELLDLAKDPRLAKSLIAETRDNYRFFERLASYPEQTGFGEWRLTVMEVDVKDIYRKAIINCLRYLAGPDFITKDQR